MGDLDLLCLEDNKSSTCTHEVWDEMVQKDPAGTMGMKPPEVQIVIPYVAITHIHVISHKSDVWSGCVTMMNVLVGKGANADSQIQVFLATCIATQYSKLSLIM